MSRVHEAIYGYPKDNQVKINGIVLDKHPPTTGDAREFPLYPYRDCFLQAGYFKEKGLDISGYFPATINVNISPCKIDLKNSLFKFENFKWKSTNDFITISVCPCQIIFEEFGFDSFLFYQNNNPGSDQHNPHDIVHIVAPYIPGIKSGVQVQLEFNPDQVNFFR